MVPGSVGCGSAVLAAMTMLAPSWAALRAMAFPMPLLAPVTNSVQPANLLGGRKAGDTEREIQPDMCETSSYGNRVTSE